jgi:tetratricopeptide (TPR) repeat protein
LAHLGRVDEAIAAWQTAVDLDAKQSVGWRNLGLAAASRNDLSSAETLYRRAIDARPEDQTLHRDLAEILIADGRRTEAIQCLEAMPLAGMRRAEITVMLAEAYMAENRDEDCIQILESTPYFVNWEGQDVTWRLFHQAHLKRGQRRLEHGDASGALADFAAALTYPENLNVGRSNKPQEACAQYWRGRALAALGRTEDARAAWRAGAEGADVAGRQNEYRQKCQEALAKSSP